VRWHLIVTPLLNFETGRCVTLTWTDNIGIKYNSMVKVNSHRRTGNVTEFNENRLGGVKMIWKCWLRQRYNGEYLFPSTVGINRLYLPACGNYRYI
jgi:hypothetical protein